MYISRYNLPAKKSDLFYICAGVSVLVNVRAYFMEPVKNGGLFYICAGPSVLGIVVYISGYQQRMEVRVLYMCWSQCSRNCHIYFRVPAKNGGLCFIYVLVLVF